MKAVLKLKGVVISVWEGGARVSTDMGEVYVPARHVDARIVWRAEIVLEVTKSDRVAKSHKDRFSPFEAERVLAVQAPAPLPPPTEVYAWVEWFDYRKGKGQVRLVGEHPFEDCSARLPGSVIKGFKAQKNDPVRVVVELTPDGLIVTSLEFSDRITAAVKALERKAKQPVSSSTRIVADAAGTLTKSGGLIPAPPKWD